MKTLVVYDSVHGNTEKIAKAIGDAITGEDRGGVDYGREEAEVIKERLRGLGYIE